MAHELDGRHVERRRDPRRRAPRAVVHHRAPVRHHRGHERAPLLHGRRLRGLAELVRLRERRGAPRHDARLPPRALQLRRRVAPPRAAQDELVHLRRRQPRQRRARRHQQAHRRRPGGGGLGGQGRHHRGARRAHRRARQGARSDGGDLERELREGRRRAVLPQPRLADPDRCRAFLRHPHGARVHQHRRRPRARRPRPRHRPRGQADSRPVLGRRVR